MRILLDTNIYISALLFPSEQFDLLFERISTKHELVLCSYVVNEIYTVIERKFPGKKTVIDNLLQTISYDYVETSLTSEYKNINLRDEKDLPILYTAIEHNVDVILTGDKDLLQLEIAFPKILTVSDFLLNY
ncbi:MAG: putative toxin-antitoxin system toxin component, PIN family [Chloroflexi bacterium]|nr:putative toxin-antitoxin system toxin component, PIN family [Chloroflexota bacterium]